MSWWLRYHLFNTNIPSARQTETTCVGPGWMGRKPQMIQNWTDCTHIPAAQELKVNTVSFQHNVDHKYSECYSKRCLRVVWQNHNHKNVHFNGGFSRCTCQSVGVIPNSLKLMMSEMVQRQGKRQELHLLLQSVLRNIDYAVHFLL